MLVYQWKERDMKVTFTEEIALHPVVELALGREVRTLQLAEFTDFPLTIIEAGRKSATVYLKSIGNFPQDKTTKKGKLTARHGLRTHQPRSDLPNRRRRFQNGTSLLPVEVRGPPIDKARRTL